jgi:hypothetical protein
MAAAMQSFLAVLHHQRRRTGYEAGRSIFQPQALGHCWPSWRTGAPVLLTDYRQLQDCQYDFLPGATVSVGRCVPATRAQMLAGLMPGVVNDDF